VFDLVWIDREFCYQERYTNDDRQATTTTWATESNKYVYLSLARWSGKSCVSKIVIGTGKNEKKNAQRRRKHCALAVVRRSQIFSSAADHFRGLDGQAVYGHYLYLQTQFGEDRCTKFPVIVVTDPPTHPTLSHTHTLRQDRLQYTAPQLARNVTKISYI